MVSHGTLKFSSELANTLAASMTFSSINHSNHSKKKMIYALILIIHQGQHYLLFVKSPLN